MLWLVAAALAAVVTVAILAPFLRRDAVEEAEDPAAYDLRVYRSQLVEVDRDTARGLILPEEADRLRLEIGRRVLEADRALRAAGGGTPGRSMSQMAVAAGMVVLAVAAFALYQWIGAPGLPDEPLADRFAQAEASYRARPTQAEAEARAAPAVSYTPAPDPEYAALIEELRATVARRPDDPEGLALLARGEARLGNAAAAADAQRRLVAAKGGAATAADHAELAGLMTDAAGGIITAEAEAEVAAALKRDPKEAQARYMQGLLMIQNRRPDRAFPIWQALLEDSPADAPWRAQVTAAMPDLAWLAGLPEWQPPTPSIPGPDAAAIEAAAGMSDAERRQMVEGMVSGLESRLATQGGSPEEWARLIGALHVLGDETRAAAILAEARGHFGTVPSARAVIEDAATKAGLP